MSLKLSCSGRFRIGRSGEERELQRASENKSGCREDLMLQREPYTGGESKSSSCCSGVLRIGVELEWCIAAVASLGYAPWNILW